MNDKILKFLAISNSGGGSSSQPNIQELNITQNGTYEAQGNVDGYNPVIVNVSGGEPEPPDDGKTRLYITVPANSMPDRDPPRNQVPLYIQQSVANGVTIDWGDGTPPETLPGVGELTTIHTYKNSGNYVISLEPADGCALGFGNPSTYQSIFGMLQYGYCSILQKLYIGQNVETIGDGAFNGCCSLVYVSIPKGVSKFGVNSFGYCYSLASINISDSIENIRIGEFVNCSSLSSVTIPNSVKDIGARAFDGCLFMKEYHFLSQTPPNLLDVSAFRNIPSDCIIYVPVGSLEAYQTATNWSIYAGQMQEEPA